MRTPAVLICASASAGPLLESVITNVGCCAKTFSAEIECAEVTMGTSTSPAKVLAISRPTSAEPAPSA